MFVVFDFVASVDEGWGTAMAGGVVFDAAGLDVVGGGVFAAAVAAAAEVAVGVAIGAVVLDVVDGNAAGPAAFDPAACGDAATLAGVLLGEATDGAVAATGLVDAATGLANPATPATATTLTPIAAWPATPAAVNDGAEPSNGVPTSHEVGPIAHRSRGAETASSARTTSGSNWEPLKRTVSSCAAARVIAFLYVRGPVMTSKESATATIRPASEMSRPLSPSG